jgi:hypothetical protein
MSEGGKEAVRVDEDVDVVAASEVRRLEERVRELERLLGRKTMEVEILKEALDLARLKKPTLLSRSHCFTSTSRASDLMGSTPAAHLQVRQPLKDCAGQVQSVTPLGKPAQHGPALYPPELASP